MKGMQTELATLLVDLQTLPNELQLSLKSIAQDHGDLLAQLATVSRQEAQEVAVEVTSIDLEARARERGGFELKSRSYSSNAQT